MYLFVDKVSLVSQMTGFAIADSMTFLLMFIAIQLSSCIAPNSNSARVMPDRSIFNDWGPFLNTAVPEVANLQTQYFGWALMIFLAGATKVEDQATMIIVLTIVSLSFAFSAGFRWATFTLVRKHLKAGNISQARWYAYLTFMLGLVTIIMVSTVIFTVKDAVATIFTSSQKSVEVIEDIVPYICITNIFDLIVACIMGYMRAF